jgi:hypothetical protein
MIEWGPLILSLPLLGLALSSSNHGKVPSGAAEATFVVT